MELPCGNVPNVSRRLPLLLVQCISHVSAFLLAFSLFKSIPLPYFFILSITIETSSSHLIMGAAIKTGSMLTPRSSFLRIIAITSLFILFILYTFRSSSTHFISPGLRQSTSYYTEKPLSKLETPSPPDSYVDCSLNASNFKILKEKYYLGDEVSYGRRYIRSQRHDIERKSLTKLDEART